MKKEVLKLLESHISSVTVTFLLSKIVKLSSVLYAEYGTAYFWIHHFGTK
jgi:hypothetical protein